MATTITQPAVRTIKLYGLAAQTFGSEFRLAVSSLAEVARALGCQIKGFRAFLVKHDFQVVLNAEKGAYQLTEDQVGMPLPAGEIHVVPILQGAKQTGIGKLIAGVVIAAVAWYASAGLAAGLGSSLIGGITYGNVALLGVGLALAGLSQLLTKKPTDPKDEQSFIIATPQNIAKQGGCVPCVYGRNVRVGSVIISSNLTTYDIAEGQIIGSYYDTNH